MSALTWLLFRAFGAVCSAVGWACGTWRREVADDRAEQARDAAWDAKHLRRPLTDLIGRDQTHPIWRDIGGD